MQVEYLFKIKILLRWPFGLAICWPYYSHGNTMDLISVGKYHYKKFFEQTSFSPTQCKHLNLFCDLKDISLQPEFIFDGFSIFYVFLFFSIWKIKTILPLLQICSSFSPQLDYIFANISTKDHIKHRQIEFFKGVWANEHFPTAPLQCFTL